LIVLRFVDAFFVHLRSLASPFGIFIFTEGIGCPVCSLEAGTGSQSPDSGTD
jgi:hypothetical protein